MFAQEETVLNQPKYYHEWLHFGFALGVNNADFILQPVKQTNFSDTLKIINQKREFGFNLGIIAEARLHEYLTVRVIPDLSFASRILYFHFEGTDTFVLDKSIESTYLNFPVDFKLRSKRVNNVAGYLVAGGKYVIDLASQKKAKNDGSNPNDIIIKLRKDDLAYQLGAGVDFFLPYFKFAVELKLSAGLKNLIIKDNTEFSNSIERLRSKIFLISFTFEG